MKVERVKYIIWAADMNRAVAFYVKVFGGTVLKQNDVISEVSVCEGLIGIHGGGEGARTWTGLSFQVPDVIAGAAEIVAAGGHLVREPQPENGISRPRPSPPGLTPPRAVTKSAAMQTLVPLVLFFV